MNWWVEKKPYHPDDVPDRITHEDEQAISRLHHLIYIQSERALMTWSGERINNYVTWATRNGDAYSKKVVRVRMAWLAEQARAGDERAAGELADMTAKRLRAGW